MFPSIRSCHCNTVNTYVQWLLMHNNNIKVNMFSFMLRLIQVLKLEWMLCLLYWLPNIFHFPFHWNHIILHELFHFRLFLEQIAALGISFDMRLEYLLNCYDVKIAFKAVSFNLHLIISNYLQCKLQMHIKLSYI